MGGIEVVGWVVVVVQPALMLAMATTTTMTSGSYYTMCSDESEDVVQESQVIE